MRTKTLVFSAAALAAGLLSSSAQSNVFSANVVGYVNIFTPANTLILAANPLDNGTNDLNSLGAALPNKSSIQVWTGTAFQLLSKVAGVWQLGTSPTNFVIPVGQGFFIQAKTDTTNTFVGNVIVGPGGTNTVNLPAGVLELVGSPIPYSGDLNDTNLNIGPALPNKSSIQVWNGSSFVLLSKVAGVWQLGSSPTNMTFSVGQGFFVNAKTLAPWTQTLPAQ
jgi:hypothetical protein